MSAPRGLHDLGGGSINNDGRFVDGTGTSAGEVRPYDELYQQSAVHFLRTYDGDKPFLLIVCLVNPRLYPKPESTHSFAGLIDVLPTLATVGGVPEAQRYGFRGRDLTPILTDPKKRVQDFLHFTYEDDALPLKGATCIRALVEDGWKYAVYYDPFTGAPTEYEQYDLTRDSLEMKNLAHARHATPESEQERGQLHARLADVMKANGTRPDEIRWPESADLRPKHDLANPDENGALDD